MPFIPLIGCSIGRLVLGVVLLIGVLYVLAGIALYIFQSRLVYVPGAEIKTTPAAVGMRYEEVELVASDGVRLAGWYLPLADARGTVLFCHGNAGNISHLLAVAEDAHRLGLGILLFDYRGYGQSEGTPSEEGTHRDAEAAWNYLVQEAGLAPDQIAIIGRSLGGPIAARLARDKTPAALFLEETFTSIPELGRDLYPIFPVGLLARYEYPTLEYLKQVQCPVLISHSRDDKFIVFAHGQRLYEAASQPKAFTVMRGGHSSAFSEDAATYEAGVEAFLTEVLGW